VPRPLRVLFVCPQFRPLVGGYERAAERLALALQQRGHFVEVVAERRDRSWPIDETVDGLRIRRTMVAHRAGLHSVSSVLAIGAFLARNGRRFDVLHIHQYGATAAAAIAYGRRFGRPVVLKLTVTGPEGIHETVGRPGRFAPLAPLHRQVDACVATSGRAVEEAVRFGIPADRVHRIPNGIDTTQYRPLAPTERQALRSRLGVEGRVVALFVGRLSPQKNPLGLMDAWAATPRPEGSLLILLGEGPQRAAIEERARGLGDSVRVVGRADPLPWYQAADLFLLPSLYEGLSNSLLEALACGLPVIATPVSGTEDIFAAGNVGVLVEPTPSAIAAGLESLLADPALRALRGSAARTIAEREFSLTRVASEVEALYCSLLPETVDPLRKDHQVFAEPQKELL
jgi:glycosyltransferase involved in cell wall biosynthesis